MEPIRATPKSRRVFLADANILIDYLNVDIEILGQFARQFGQVCVLGVVLQNEVQGLTENQLRKVDLTIIRAETESLVAASDLAQRSLLSFYDWLCVLEAKKRSAICLSSDGALIKVCQMENVEVRRGLWPLLELVTHGKLEANEALMIATQMANKNVYLTKVLPEFEAVLKAAVPKGNI